MTTECSKIDELMMDFLYQELDADAATQVKTHVDGCARCGAELASLTQTRQTVRGLPEIEPPAKISALLLHEAAKRKPQRAAANGGVWGAILRLLAPIQAHPAMAAVASVVLVAGIAGYLGRRGLVSEKRPAVSGPATETATGEELRLQPRSGVAVQLEDNSRGYPDEAAAHEGTTTPPAGGSAPTDKGLAEQGDGRRGGESRGDLAADDASDRWGSLAGKEDQKALAAGPRRKEAELDTLSKDVPSKLGSKNEPSKKPMAKQDMDTQGFERSLDDRGGSGGRFAEGPRDGLVGGATTTSTPTVPPGRTSAAPMAAAPPREAAPDPAPSATAPTSRSPIQDVKNTVPPAPRPRTAQGQDAWSRAEGEAAAGLAQGETGSTKGKVSATKPQPKAVAPSVTQLHTDAQRKAKSGACGEALALRQRLYKVDPGYYDRAVRVDRTFEGCLSAEKKRSKRAADEVSPSAPAPAQQQQEQTKQ